MYSVGFALREDTEASPTPCDRPFQHTFLPPCVSVELQPPSPLLLRAGLLLSLGRRKPPQCTCRTSLKRAGGDGLTSIPADRESWGGGGERDDYYVFLSRSSCTSRNSIYLDKIQEIWMPGYDRPTKEALKIQLQFGMWLQRSLEAVKTRHSAVAIMRRRDK